MSLHPSESVNAQIHHPQSQAMLGQWFAKVGAIAALFALVSPTAPAAAIYGFGDSEVSRGDYGRCTSNLTGAKLSPEQAASACARAFKPDDLGTCVRRTINDPLTADAVLSACREVRRPVDLSACVANIRAAFGNAPALTVLDNCRRSLLPKRYANCVVGVGQTSKLSPVGVMDTCIDASETDRDIDPTFIRYSATPNAAPAPTDQLSPSVVPTNPSSSPSTGPTAPTTPATP